MVLSIGNGVCRNVRFRIKSGHRKSHEKRRSRIFCDIIGQRVSTLAQLSLLAQRLTPLSHELYISLDIPGCPANTLMRKLARSLKFATRTNFQCATTTLDQTMIEVPYD